MFRGSFRGRDAFKGWERFLGLGLELVVRDAFRGKGTFKGGWVTRGQPKERGYIQGERYNQKGV